MWSLSARAPRSGQALVPGSGRADAPGSRFRLRQSGPSSRSVPACERRASERGAGWAVEGGWRTRRRSAWPRSAAATAPWWTDTSSTCGGGYVVRGRGGRAGAARERRQGINGRRRGTPTGSRVIRLRSAPHSPRAAHVAPVPKATKPGFQGA